jgi:peptidoglycan hydrolase-like protein with peptidoglycan-binding domain
MTFAEQLHPRGTGAQGGQFVVKGSGGKTTKQDTLSYDGKRGAGYGAAGGDANVKTLQRELNRLGIQDAAGNPLKLDGKLGPKTTAAIKRLQRKMGLPADGKVSVGFLNRIKKVAPGGAKKSAAPSKKAAPKKAPAKKSAAPAKKPAKPSASASSAAYRKNAS